MKTRKRTNAKQTPQERAAAVGRIGDMLAGMERLADAQEAGGPLPAGTVVRTYDIPAPTAYTPAAVFKLRRRVGVSQAAFARLLGVSTVLAQSWEQGKRVPSTLASRLLDTVAADPEMWFEMIGATVPATGVAELATPRAGIIAFADAIAESKRVGGAAAPTSGIYGAKGRNVTGSGLGTLEATVAQGQKMPPSARRSRTAERQT